MPRRSGGTFERELSNLLSEWWLCTPRTDPDYDTVFWRTAMSGGRATTRKKTGKRTGRSHCGDIASIDPISAPFTKLITLEAKSGYASTGSLHNLLDKLETSALQTYEEWILQAQEASVNAGTPYWMIVHWRPRRAILVTLPHSMYARLGDFHHDIAPCAEIVMQNGRAVHVVPFEVFVKCITPDDVRRAVAEMEK